MLYVMDNTYTCAYTGICYFCLTLFVTGILKRRYINLVLFESREIVF